MTIGPVQLLVIGFDDPSFTGEIRAELERLRTADITRLIDVIVVRKDENGNVEQFRHSDLTEAEAEEVGAFAGALVGLGMAGEAGLEMGAEAGIEAVRGGSNILDDDDVWYIADAIPPGSAAAVALIEHRWAIELRDGIRRAGGRALVDAWVHPDDLVAVGLAAAAEAATP